MIKKGVYKILSPAVLLVYLLITLFATPIAVIAGSSSSGSYGGSNNSIIKYNGQTYYKCSSDTTSNLDTCDFGFINSPVAAYGVPMSGSLASNTSVSVLYFNQTMVTKLQSYCNNNAGACSSSTANISSFSCSAFWSTFGSGSSFIVGGQTLSDLTSGVIASSSKYNTTNGVYYYSAKPLTFQKKIGNSSTAVTSCLGPNQPSNNNNSSTSGQNITLSGYVGQAPTVTTGSGGTVINPSGSGGGSATKPQPNVNASCTISGFLNLSWIICPIIDGISKAISGFYDQILAKMLNIDSSQFLSSSSGFYQAWSSLRIIANIFLVIILLIVVFGETIGGSILDSYSIKKIVPRLVLMVILANLSIYIVVGLIDIFNIFGKGIVALLTSPFNNLSISTTTFSGFLGAGGFLVLVAGIFAGGVIFGFLGFFLLFLLIPAILFLVATFVTLALRQIIVVFLLLISPVAFILYVLPNTEKYFKKWWSLLIKTLMVYPIVFTVYAISQIAAYTLFHVNGTGALNAIDSLLAIFAMLAPIFLIPFSFKLSGGLVGNAYGLINGKIKGAAYKNWMAKRRGAQREKYTGKASRGDRFVGNNSVTDAANKVAQIGALASQVGINPRRMRTNYQQAASMASAAGNEAALKNPDLADISGSSTMLRAGQRFGTNTKKLEEYLESEKIKKETERRTKEKIDGPIPDEQLRLFKQQSRQEARSVERAVRAVGQNKFNELAGGLIAKSSDGYNYSLDSDDRPTGGFAEMALETVRAAGGDRQTATRNLLANMGMAASAKKEELTPSAGAALGYMDQIINELSTNNGELSIETIKSINEGVLKNISTTKPGSQIGSAKKSAIEALAPAFVNEAKKTAEQVTLYTQQKQAGFVTNSFGDNVQEKLDENYKNYIKNLATIANIYDVANGVSSENSQAFGDKVLSKLVVSPLTGQNVTIKDLIDEARGTELFQMYRTQMMMPSQNRTTTTDTDN